MKRLLDMHPDRYKQFLFSILQILPKTITEDSVIKTESLYKGNTAQCGKSRFRENLSSDDGTFSQMYFVYLKKK